MFGIVYTDEEQLKCPNPHCRSGFQPNNGKCVDCSGAHNWPEDAQTEAAETRRTAMREGTPTARPDTRGEG